ncbi:hypothetical protein EMCRGX_G025508 [Ephydatia muelleri]
MNLLRDCWRKRPPKAPHSLRHNLELETFLQSEGENFAKHGSVIIGRAKEDANPHHRGELLATPSVEFLLCYDAQRRTLLVFLQRIRHLSTPGGSSVNAVLSDSSLTSKTIYQSFDPIYNVPLEFSGLSLRDICDCTLHLQVYAHCEEFWSSGGEFIGSVSLLLKDPDLYWSLESRAIDTRCREIIQINAARGEVLLTAGFGERVKSIHGNLQRARNLSAMDVCGTSDPYVNICLVDKDTMVAKWKSSVKKETLDPVYNEPFYFDIKETNLCNISLKVTVMDYDKVGRNECERRLEKALPYKSSGILSVQPPSEVQPLRKVFHFPQQMAAGSIQTQPAKHMHKKHPSPRCEVEGDAGTECGPLSCQRKQAILQFSLCYNLQRCTLDVHLQKVSGLFTENGKPGIQTLLVILFLALDRKDAFEAKATCDGGLTVFDKVFEFTGLSLNEILQNKLVFHIYDSILPTKKQIYGTVEVPFDKAGILRQSIYTKEIHRIEASRKSVCKFRGEVQLSLTYKPEMALLQGVVHRTANLRADNLISSGRGSYVKVTLFHGQQLLAKWNSTIKMASVYNEKFQFDVLAMDLSLVFIRITVACFDRLDRDKPIGAVSIGDHSPSETGRQHWAAIQSYRNESITFWHALERV